jgi:signal transduction histidine kinase
VLFRSFLREETDPERRRALALMNAQAMRVYEMIADMRLFARPPQPEPEPIELVGLIDRLIEDFAPRAAQQETIVCRRGDAGPLEIEADPAQLSVAIRAMCQNALEAIGSGGHIEIALEQHAREVQIRVSDDGPGIAPEERRHLFDPFYSARQAGRGLGLGLSKCWRIVTNHGGRIDVESQPGHGAMFTITLPRRQP